MRAYALNVMRLRPTDARAAALENIRTAPTYESLKQRQGIQGRQK
jgi:hypothetical protein